MLDELFAPQTEMEREIAATEALAVSVQLAIQRAMMDQGISQKQLAERLGVSPARISQMLSTKGANITIKTLGRIAAALGENFDFVRHRRVSQDDGANGSRTQRTTLKPSATASQYRWQQDFANDNDKPAKFVQVAADRYFQGAA